MEGVQSMVSYHDRPRVGVSGDLITTLYDFLFPLW